MIPFQSVVVAWKDTREAKRAAADALPLLGLSQRVTVVEIARETDLTDAHRRIQDVVVWLGSHGIKALPRAILSRGGTAAHLDKILEEQTADLVVAGGYGRSRLREWAFGGVTHDLLQGTRCALMSH